MNGIQNNLNTNSWLSLCSEGQSSVGFNILGFFFIFICLILVFSMNVCIKYVRARRAKKRDLKEKEEIEMHLSSMNTNVNNREARTAYADRNMSQHYGANHLGVNLEFEDLSLTVEQAGEYKIVLNNVSGIIKHSELTGIMGCSGRYVSNNKQFSFIHSFIESHTCCE